MIKNKNNGKSKGGFTLVELLAVIVVLAIILVIAVPKIMDVIKQSREGALVSSAKLIVSQAETKYLSNTTIGIEDTIECADVAKINNTDYESCTIKFDSSGKAKVSIVGSGKFDGMKVCYATRINAEVVEGECPTEQEAFTYYTLVDYEILDKVKCVDVLLNSDLGLEEGGEEQVCAQNLEGMNEEFSKFYSSLILFSYISQNKLDEEYMISENILSRGEEYIAISSYDESFGTEVVIPESISNLPVRVIMARFSDNAITKLYIPSTVTMFLSSDIWPTSLTIIDNSSADIDWDTVLAKSCEYTINENLVNVICVPT